MLRGTLTSVPKAKAGQRESHPRPSSLRQRSHMTAGKGLCSDLSGAAVCIWQPHTLHRQQCGMHLYKSKLY